MKAFSVAVAVAVVLTFICIQQSSAVPITEVQEREDPMSNDDPAEHGEMPEESQQVPINIRQKRQYPICRPYCYKNSLGEITCDYNCSF
uniref:Hepcidin n=1 Tax=Lycodichthys dearborni TaxID=8201 RepID=B3FKE2_LYCDA|nr:hepcidin [Lycodichthys dearborni]ABY84845.1 hepcidin [Lycodichthys dearborni]